MNHAPKVSLSNTTLFITGTNGEKGIGRALVIEAINRGAKKIYATARDASQLEGLAAQLPGKVIPVELDVTNHEQIKQAAQLANDTQILINNAGTCNGSGCIHNYNEKNARLELEVNYLAPLNIIHAFSKNIIKNGDGAIVNIISIGGLYPSPSHITYSAAKAALHSLTQALRIETMMHGTPIPVFGVYPGPIDTDMAKGLEVNKESPANAAIRVFDGMEQGVSDITTDALADNFKGYLKTDPKVIEALKREFGKK